MNSEELEQSLRTEFESYLKQVFADMQQEITGFQEKIEAEFERHKSQLTEAFQDFSSRAQNAKELDTGFKESVVEHLRLARDEGARITATAMSEAEEMQKQADAAAPRVAGINELRDAINDISSQTSQASILKALVQHAGQFTPRGAFFIIKNEHFVGWRVFGREEQQDDSAVREIFFPISTESTLGESVRSLNTVESAYGTYAGDSTYLEKLGFGEPEKMFAVPLVARGRGVAVLYADYGLGSNETNVGALETLVRVAGLTVEILAASPAVAKSAPTASQTQQATEPERQEELSEPKDFNAVADYQVAEENQFDGQMEASASFDSPAASESTETSGFTDYQYPVESENFSAQDNFQPEAAQTDFASTDYSYTDSSTPDNYSVEEVEIVSETPAAEEFQPVYQDTQTESESYSWNQPAESTSEYTDSYTPQTEVQSDAKTFEPQVSENDYSAPAVSEYQFEDAPQSFEAPQTFETPQFESAPFEATQSYAPVVEETANPFAVESKAATESFVPQPAEAVAATTTTATKPVRSRFSDKNVDLPIEVSEDERRLHNDARRFARLLVSEIKLYNEQKVKEGRDSNDLYERLREAIDRSREMYDKRIQPPVAAKFDYFHYEVVNTLAEGDEAKLGGSYPGAAV
ncbi:MAG: hypothetical protein M3033_00150 [Acidobacteriota bacterium]|nr:hypothetical protein [Acidobacteriota bacterium]